MPDATAPKEQAKPELFASLYGNRGHALSQPRIQVLVGLPNMLSQNWSLLRRLFEFATDSNYQLQISWATEKRHHDYARNVIVTEFLKSTCEWLLMIDADVEPHPQLLTLTKYDKPIIAAVVFCWIQEKLMPSVWQRAPCEQCKNAEIWEKEGKIHDLSQYRAEGPWLLRWNPFRNTFQQFYSRETHKHKGGLKCRCQGTGLDPWVFRVAQNITEPIPPIKVDSVGTAAIMIRRDVLEKMEPPWFQFLYRPDMQILCTEDHVFNWRASCYGFDVWCDQTMACSHLKVLDLLQIHNWSSQVYKEGYETAMREMTEKEEKSVGVIVPTEKELAAYSRN